MAAPSPKQDWRDWLGLGLFLALWIVSALVMILRHWLGFGPLLAPS